MHLLIEKGIGKGMSIVSRRHANANKPYLNDYDPGKENNYLM